MGSYLDHHVSFDRLPPFISEHERTGAIRRGARKWPGFQERVALCCALVSKGTYALYAPHPFLGLEEEGKRI